MIAGAEYTLVLKFTSNIGDNFNVEIKRPSDVVFGIIEKEISVPTYSERGYYNFTIPAEYMTELGRYIFTAVNLDNAEEQVLEVECLPSPINTEVALNKCIVTGNIRDITGDYDVEDQTLITALPRRLPTALQNTFISGKKIKTLTDYQGNFSFPIIIGMEVIFEIKDSGVRFQATIPDLPTVNLKDLMPV